MEFSESKYIGLTMFSLVQGFLTGIPIVAVVRETPQAFYLVLAMLIFLLCTVTLSLIFLPKYIMQRRYAGLSESDQKKLIAQSVIRSAFGKDSGLRNPSYNFEGSGTLQRVNEAEDRLEPLDKVNEASNEKSVVSLIRSSADPGIHLLPEDSDPDAAGSDSGIKVSSASVTSSLKRAAKGEDSTSEVEVDPSDHEEFAPSGMRSETETSSSPKEEDTGSDSAVEQGNEATKASERNELVSEKDN